MKIGELTSLLKAGEWNDIEFKEARRAAPKSAFETVCAFSNTHGGWLVFGVSQSGEEYRIVGVEKPDKVQNEFLSVLRADKKVSHDVHATEQRMDIGGKTVLIFYIAENPRTRKPVYLDGDIRRTFLRKGGGDFKARMQDIERMLRDATADRWDTQPFDRVDIAEAFNPSSLRWYRDRFHTVNDGFDPRQPDLDFLYDWGYLIKDQGRLIPTRAAAILFGSLRAVRNLIPRPVIDIQFLGYATDEAMPESRWIDRVVSEENIIQSWLQLLAKYKFFMPKPFQGIDPTTLGRRDDPPGFRVFREAAVNLLIHQDYGDHSRKAVIKFFRDGIQFWNPGDVFGDDSRLFEPGEKEVRNPAIAMAMRRIAMCEQAGTGLRMMREEWRRLGHPEPTIHNDRSWKSFELFVPGLGKEVDMASDLLKSMFENHNGTGKGAAPDRKPPTPEVAPEVTPQVAPEVTPEVKKMLTSLTGEMTRREIQEKLGLKDEKHFRENYQQAALNLGLIEMTIPDKPRSRRQKYRLTSVGRDLANQIKGSTSCSPESK
jgi:ATP-dependent DNA helicase RecG